MPQGVTQGGQGWVQAEREARLGRMPLVGSEGKMLWGFCAIQTRKAPGGRGDCCSQGLLGSHIRKFAVTPQAVTEGVHLHEEADVSVRPLQAAWPNKMDARAAIPCCGLDKQTEIASSLRLDKKSCPSQVKEVVCKFSEEAK